MTTRSEAQNEKDNAPKEQENLKRPVPHKEIVKVPFSKKEPEKTFRVGTMLNEDHKEGSMPLIREYKDIFAWGPENMSGIDTSVALHKLHVDSMYKPIKQKK
ncbi:hypothetical protein LIER_14598 [Lithospermum erythrorhizon]|uniref:Uncharacterized protein n=1 Tax=Lithospermum erythrorhizon TaxID=34254 RepID=A0AAV3Q2X3_LITER